MDCTGAQDGTQDTEGMLHSMDQIEDDRLAEIEVDQKELETGLEVELSAQDMVEPGNEEGSDDKNLEPSPSPEPQALEQSCQESNEAHTGGESGIVEPPLKSAQDGHVGSEVARTKSGRSRANVKQNHPLGSAKSPTTPKQLQTGDLRDNSDDSLPRSPERPRIEYNALVQVRAQPA